MIAEMASKRIRTQVDAAQKIDESEAPGEKGVDGKERDRVSENADLCVSLTSRRCLHFAVRNELIFT